MLIDVSKFNDVGIQPVGVLVTCVMQLIKLGLSVSDGELVSDGAGK